MKPEHILTSWKLRIAYLLLAACLGASFTYGSGLPLGPSIGAFVCVALLRITLEVRGQTRK
jgi:hypothetical protein